MAVLVKFFAAIGALATLTTAAFLVGKAVGPPPRAQIPPPTPAAPASSSPATPHNVGQSPMTVVPVTGLAEPAPTADHDRPGGRRAKRSTAPSPSAVEDASPTARPTPSTSSAPPTAFVPGRTPPTGVPTPTTTGPAATTEPVEDDEPGHGHHD